MGTLVIEIEDISKDASEEFVKKLRAILQKPDLRAFWFKEAPIYSTMPQEEFLP